MVRYCSKRRRRKKIEKSIIQLNPIEEQVKLIGQEFKRKGELALSLVCSSETKGVVKAYRADMRKEFARAEELRMQAKNICLAPYERFERVYKQYITQIFNSTDQGLKDVIGEVEKAEVEEKRAKILALFEEYKKAYSIDFLTFDMLKININLSASESKLEKQVIEDVKKISEDIKLISSQEEAAEILVEYKKTLDVSNAINIVNDRHKKIEKEREAMLSVSTHTVDEKLKSAVKSFNDSFEAPSVISSNQPTYEITLTITETIENLREIKRFLDSSSYIWYQVD